MRSCKKKRHGTCDDFIPGSEGCAHYKSYKDEEGNQKKFCELEPDDEPEEESSTKTEWCHLAKLDSVMSLTYDRTTPARIDFSVYQIERMETDENGVKQARISPDARPEIEGAITFSGDITMTMTCKNDRVNKLLAIPAALRGIAKNMGFPLEV